jgi:hypothetical protein
MSRKFDDWYCWYCGRKLKYAKNIIEDEVKNRVMCGRCVMNPINKIVTKQQRVEILNIISDLTYLFYRE